MPQGKNKKLLSRRVNKGHKGFPIATVVFYGPDNSKATKVVCGIIQSKGQGAEPLKKWLSSQDVRKSEKILNEILAFIDEQKAQSVTMVDGIFGCPHEEVIDYPEGESCPQCPYWKNRDRYTNEIIH